MVGTADRVLIREVALIQNVLYREVPLYSNSCTLHKLPPMVELHTYVCMYLCHCVCSNSPLLWHVQPQAPPTPRHIPISLDVGTGPNIILCGQDKLVVQDPLRFVVQAGRRMQLHNLQSCHGNGNRSTALQQGPHTYVCIRHNLPFHHS